MKYRYFSPIYCVKEKGKRNFKMEIMS
uniref:Uncharacterized protein n=1 Tax=Vitis vinifera TaxID=29760 RepID=F6GVR4_VITVI